MPYLGMSKYRDLVKSTQKYHNEEDQAVILDGEQGSLEY